ncbi:non-specific lipid-transfer protein 1-like [Salvia miltiorrhiza]|uniref:non-specific lipid-transfer protein 1-like n=1 Tax=Salvia miltiorrhiza TaxID=226208 RepID=UPI0025AC58DE|nr:non-specific lipid-transfer protein 1-like [Salvia miltiorrhiza]XP_057804322.1 non-specific lipid-transfer protein 1-like [Salvia miltiorrhiza]
MIASLLLLHNSTRKQNSIMNKATFLLLLVAAAAVAAAPPAKISCGEVTTTLAPCFEYVLGGGTVPLNCCAGVKSLYKAASTTADRRNVCVCLKSVTGSASAAAVRNAKSLPGKCGVSLPYEITPAIDCTKVK